MQKGACVKKSDTDGWLLAAAGCRAKKRTVICVSDRGEVPAARVGVASNRHCAGQVGIYIQAPPRRDC